MAVKDLEPVEKHFMLFRRHGSVLRNFVRFTGSPFRLCMAAWRARCKVPNKEPHHRLEHLPGERGCVSLLRPEADRPVERRQIASRLVLRQRKRTTVRVQSHRRRQDHVCPGEKHFDRCPRCGDRKGTVDLSLPQPGLATGKSSWHQLSGRASDGCDRRLLIAFANNLEAINAANGQLITSFGNGRYGQSEGRAGA